MEKANIYSQIEQIERIKKILFYVSAIAIFIAETLDQIFIKLNTSLLVINYAVAAIMLITLFLHYTKRINIKLASAIVIYAIFLDILTSPFLRIHEPNLAIFYYRIAIIGFAIIPYAGIAISKYHIVFIGSIYQLNYFLILFLSKNTFIVSGLLVFSITLIVYTIGIYVLIGNLFHALYTQKVLLDISDKSNKLLTERKNQLQKANESRNRLFSIISHDLRSPFNSILGFLKLGAEAMDSNDIDKSKKYYKIVKETANSTYLLLLNLLDWSRTERGDLYFSPEIIYIPKMVDEIINYVNHEIDKKHISIKTDFSEDLTICADKKMLNSIIRNLLSNAIKFTPNGGNIEIGTKIKKSKSVIYITDSGVGLKDEELKSLFSGKQIKSKIGTNNEAGNGLGLIICKEFIDRHRGEIWAENNSNNGLTIYISLP